MNQKKREMNKKWTRNERKSKSQRCLIYDFRHVIRFTFVIINALKIAWKTPTIPRKGSQRDDLRPWGRWPCETVWGNSFLTNKSMKQSINFSSRTLIHISIFLTKRLIRMSWNPSVMMRLYTEIKNLFQDWQVEEEGCCKILNTYASGVQKRH